MRAMTRNDKDQCNMMISFFCRDLSTRKLTVTGRPVRDLVFRVLGWNVLWEVPFAKLSLSSSPQPHVQSKLSAHWKNANIIEAKVVVAPELSTVASMQLKTTKSSVERILTCLGNRDPTGYQKHVWAKIWRHQLRSALRKMRQSS